MDPTGLPDASAIIAQLHAGLKGQRRRSARAKAALDRAAPILVEALAHHWGTHQGTRVRHVIWSLYGCSHILNLGDACTGLDQRLAWALAAAISARLILGPEVEPKLAEILRQSGEFTRFDRAEKLTPDRLVVIYPPAPASSTELRRMADTMDQLAGKNRQPW